MAPPYTRDPTCQTLGIVVADIAAGWARLEMRAVDTMVNSHGTIHGGHVCLPADAAFAYAANSHGPVAIAQSAPAEFRGHSVVLPGRRVPQT